MKLIKSGEIDAALGKLRDWYPQIVQVDSNLFDAFAVIVILVNRTVLYLPKK